MRFRLRAMLKFTVSAFAAALFVAGCASDKHEPWLTRGLTPETPDNRDHFTLERTACYGVCPVYTVTVDDRDVLQFRGERFVAEMGGAVGKRLPDGSYKKLAAIAKAHEFDRFDAAYPNDDVSNCPRMATDSPSVIVGFAKGDQTRTVSVYKGCSGFEGRKRFEAMVAAMDAVLDIDDFVGPRDAFYGDKE